MTPQDFQHNGFKSGFEKQPGSIEEKTHWAGFLGFVVFFGFLWVFGFYWVFFLSLI